MLHWAVISVTNSHPLDKPIFNLRQNSKVNGKLSKDIEMAQEKVLVYALYSQICRHGIQ